MPQDRGTARNSRVQLTDAERARIDALDETFATGPPTPEGADLLLEARRAATHETLEALRSAIPDFDERTRSHRERFGTDLEKLKGTGGPVYEHVTPVGRYPFGGLANPGHAEFGTSTQPDNVGELWWAETAWFASAPDNTVSVDIDNDPNRIWGHIRYDGDPLMSGHVGIAMTFILTPDRIPRTSRRTFEVRPELRPGGWVSGWTDQYHPIWHADDKWSKCWHFLSATLTLGSGPVLAADSLHQNLFFLENANPVGQGNASEFFGWTPILRFDADMFDLRQRGISIILRTELRYDFQLEGGADIWFRHNPGSAAESVPSFDNAITFRCWPGIVPL